jgi:Tol biopolymer transport system component
MNDQILFNGRSFIWKCDAEGNELHKVVPGARASVSHSQDKFACYSDTGIYIVSAGGEILKRLELEVWRDITITWSPDDSWISFFDEAKNITMRYFLANDSVAELGKNIYQPVWNNRGDAFVYNREEPDGVFGVYISSPAGTKKISNEKQNAFVPIWSNKNDLIAYLEILPDSLQKGYSDLLRSRLVLYDLQSATCTLAAEDAGFTDQVFPQFTFSENDEWIYYTGIDDRGYGRIMRLSVNSHQEEIILRGDTKDYRFPQLMKLRK